MRTFSQKACLCFLFLLSIIGSRAQAPRIVVNPLGHSAKIHNLIFTPDGHRIISVSEDKTIRIWQAETGEMLKKFESQIGEGPEGMFYASALSPDGKLLAVAGYKVESESENYIIVIDLEKGTQVSTAIGHSDIINTLSFSGNGKYLASGAADNTVKIWKVESAPRLTVIANITIPSPVSCIAFNKTTQDLAVAHESSDILLFGLAALDKGVTKFTPRVLKQHKGTVVKLAYTLDGTYMASSSFENELILWKADGSIVKEFENLENPINAIAFSSDSKIMVGLDVIGKGTSWGIPGGNKFADYAGHDNTVFSAAFAPSHKGSYVVASAGGINNEIILWNPINGLAVRKIKGKGNALLDLAFGSGMELFIAQELSNDKKPLYKTSFNFESLTLNRNPVSANGGTKRSYKGVSQTGQNTLDLPKGKKNTNRRKSGWTDPGLPWLG